MPTAAGFDCGSYPGDAALHAWASGGTYQFVGYYLPAPCHGSAFTPWTGKAAFIAGLGLGFAVVYVGLQQTGCGAAALSHDKGVEHGRDTLARCESEAFPNGTVVFLDVEHFDGSLSGAMEDYVRGWIGAILDDGSIKPGIYCAKRNADELRGAAQREYDARGLSGRPAFWITSVSNPSFDIRSSTPDQSGVPFADVWQGRIDVSGEQDGVQLNIDQNVAMTDDPSGVRSGFVLT
jgi:hypothetical protein